MLDTDPCLNFVCMFNNDPSSGTTGGGGVCPVGDYFLEITGMCAPDEPPQEIPVRPAAVECTFDGTVTFPPHWASVVSPSGQNVDGFFAPISFLFSATGGAGLYTWNDTQTYSATGVVVYDSGTATPPYPLSGVEHLENVADNSRGPQSVFRDAPGLIKTNLYGTVVLANVATNFTLNVSVSSAGNTVPCPSVRWLAVTQWMTENGQLTATESVRILKGVMP